jgi:hypothetical protein
MADDATKLAQDRQRTNVRQNYDLAPTRGSIEGATSWAA